MNLNQLFEGPSRVALEFGATTEILRVLPRVDPEFRMVRVEVTPLTTTRKFLYPWRKSDVLHSWDMTATLTTKSGRTYTCQKIIRMPFDRGVEYVAMEVVHEATIEKLKQFQKHAAAM